MNKIQEGQTQVYTNGKIEPQYGVNTNAPHLNSPPKQLIDLTLQFLNGKRSDSQVLAILVGMGVEQQLAISAINYCKSIRLNKEKNITSMNFTLPLLYENILKSIDKLNIIKNDGSRVSYSASTALNILEKSLHLFPHGKYAEYLKDKINSGEIISEDELEKIKENRFAIIRIGESNEIGTNIPVFVGQTTGFLAESGNDEADLIEKAKLMNRQSSVNGSNTTFTVIELTEDKTVEILESVEKMKSSVDTTVDVKDTILKKTIAEDEKNPNLKFKIAKILNRDLNQYNWLNPIHELREYINNAYNNMKWSFRISEAIETTSLQKGALVESLINDLTDTLKEPYNVKNSFSNVANKHIWSNEVKSILNEMKISENKAVSNKSGKINTVLSPVIENENGLNFYLHGKTYALKEGKIKQSIVNDVRFFNILEGLKLFKYKDNSLFIYGENGKVLEYNLNEETLKIGESIISDFNSNSLQLRDTLLATNIFGFKNTDKINTVVKFFESIDYLYEMDNFVDIQSTEFANMFLTLISIDEGYWVNKINSGMGINEMMFIPSATDTVETIKEFINYDATLILSEKLISEGNEKAEIIKRRSKIEDRIKFLEEKRAAISETTKKLKNSSELTEAIKLINGEIRKFEKELQETYDLNEKSKKQYLDGGYVEAKINRNIDSFKKGDEVYVNAEEYSSLGDDSILTVIDAKTNKEYAIKRELLKILI